MTPSESIKIVIYLQRRRDGGLRAWSDDVPGLVLSHSNPDHVMADIIPAVEAIMAEALGHPVRASTLIPAREIIGPLSPSPGGLSWVANVLRRVTGPPSEIREYAATACLA